MCVCVGVGGLVIICSLHDMGVTCLSYVRCNIFWECYVVRGLKESDSADVAVEAGFQVVMQLFM